MKFLTISAPVKSILKVKGSKFLGFAYPVEKEDEINSILASLRKQYYDATHHCYAWQLGFGKDIIFRYHDDGEPSGTAGKPIRMAISHRELTNILIVSVRYFGGTKLGTGGLARAYGQSAAETLDAATIIQIEQGEKLCFICSYEYHPIVMRALNEQHIISLKEHYGESVTLEAEIDEREVAQLLEKVKNVTNGNVAGRIIDPSKHKAEINANPE
ncbi:MAG: YigZ family protein [FCB group bacterium]|nr:YigZ family protein [FCB group bacterium]